MIKQLMSITVVLSASATLIAAPPRDQEKARKNDDRRPAPQAVAKPRQEQKNIKNDRRPAGKPDTDKPKVNRKPEPRKPEPYRPYLQPVVVTSAPYRQVRNTYTIQLNPDKSIIFEQRYVGTQELRDKIRMVKYDRPRPQIRIRVVDGVESGRLNFVISELKKAGFDDVEIIRLRRRAKFVPQPHHPGKRIKR